MTLNDTHAAGRSATVRIMVLVNVRIYREGIVAILSRCERFHLLDAPARLSAPDVESLQPDILILDLAIQSWRELAAALRERTPALELIAIGVNESEDEIIEFAEAGVTAYVGRDASADHLIDVIESASREELICSPRIAGALVRRLGSMASQRDRTDMILTIREREVLTLIREDLGNKQIAERLQIAEATVKNHVHNLLEKLNVKRRAQAAKMTIHPHPSLAIAADRRRG